MEDYRSNSHKSNNEEKKIEKVITGTAKVKKKNDIQKFADLFVPDDVSNIKTYILLDVIIPLIKKALLDTVQTILYPDSRSGNRSTASKISYMKCYDKENDRRDYDSNRTKVGYSYDDIVLDSFGEAEEVLRRMDELVSTYGMVRVADLYDLVDITSNYTDNNYGWTDIRSAKAVRVRDGYMLKLPRALPIK